MKKIYLTFIAFFLIVSVNAQYGITKKRKLEAELIKSLPLLVVLHEYDAPFYKKMKVDLKEAVLKYWNYSEDIIFVSKNELREYYEDESKKDKYAYLMFSEKLYQANVPPGCFCIGLLNKKTFTHFKKFGNSENELTMADYQQGLYWLQKDLTTVMNFKELRANAKQIIDRFKKEVNESTLLLDKDLITEKLIEDIDKVYSYSYKIVSKNEIDKAILDKTPNVLYLKPYYFISRPLNTTSRVRSTTGSFANGSNTVTSSGSGAGHPTITTVETERVKMDKITTNYIYKAEDNQPFAMFKTNSKEKTTLKQFEKGLKILK